MLMRAASQGEPQVLPDRLIDPASGGGASSSLNLLSGSVIETLRRTSSSNASRQLDSTTISSPIDPEHVKFLAQSRGSPVVVNPARRPSGQRSDASAELLNTMVGSIPEESSLDMHNAQWQPMGMEAYNLAFEQAMQLPPGGAMARPSRSVAPTNNGVLQPLSASPVPSLNSSALEEGAGIGQAGGVQLDPLSATDEALVSMFIAQQQQQQQQMLMQQRQLAALQLMQQQLLFGSSQGGGGSGHGGSLYSQHLGGSGSNQGGSGHGGSLYLQQQMNLGGGSTHGGGGSSHGGGGSSLGGSSHGGNLFLGSGHGGNFFSNQQLQRQALQQQQQIMSPPAFPNSMVGIGGGGGTMQIRPQQVRGCRNALCCTALPLPPTLLL